MIVGHVRKQSGWHKPDKLREGAVMSEQIMYLPYALVVFGLLILFHELGHFAVAKLAGVQVYEFSIGFGPRLTGFRKGETAYNIRIVPLGGFVRMAGMDPEEDQREAAKKPPETNAPEDRDLMPVPLDARRSFMHQSVLKRMAIIAAGPVMNFALAIMLFTVSIWFYGLPLNKNIIGRVLEGKPAAAVGMQAGDVIDRINGTQVKTWEDLVRIIHKSPNQELKIQVSRGQETKTFNVTPVKDPSTNTGLIGIEYATERPGVLTSLKLGALKTYEMLKITITFLGKMLARQMPVELSGPVRITSELAKAAETGMITLINIAGFLSIQVGLFNLFPIPALDGSRLMFLGLEGIRGTPIDPTKENFIHLVGLALLLLLMVVITYKDIVQMLS